MPVNIIIDSKFDDKGIKNAERQLQDFAGNAAKRVAQVGAAVAAAGAVVAGKLAVDAVQAASDLGESVNAVNVAFGDAAEGVLAIGENAATAMGVSQTEFNAAAVRFSAFAERVVGEGGDVAGFIGDISTRAADFASVFNIEVSEALQVFQSGLAGEAEPLKRFGINLLQTEVAAYAVANGISTSAASMTEAEKVQARYGLLMEQTNKTQGDFANTSDSLANRQRILQATFVDLQAQIGEALIPVAEELFNVFSERIIPKLEEFGAWMESEQGQIAVENFGEALLGVVETLIDFGSWFVDNLEFIKTFGIVLAGVVASVYAYRTAVTIATVATAAFNATLVLNPFGAVAAAIALVTTGVIALASAIGNETKPKQDELNESIVETRRQLEFYRGEMAKTENTKLYESTIADLEEQLRLLRIEQAEVNGRLGEFSQQAEDAKFDNLRRELGLTTGSTNELEEATVRLSIAQQARIIHEDELARAMRAGANGVENAGQYVRSITEIMDALYAQNRAAREVGEYLPSLTSQVTSNSTAFQSQTSILDSTATSTDGLASSVNGLTSSYQGLTRAATQWSEASYKAALESGAAMTTEDGQASITDLLTGTGLAEDFASGIAEKVLDNQFGISKTGGGNVAGSTGLVSIRNRETGETQTFSEGVLVDIGPSNQQESTFDQINRIFGGQSEYIDFVRQQQGMGAPGQSPATVNINVNAGVIADANEVGEVVVDSIKSYESNNGKVFADAP